MSSLDHLWITAEEWRSLIPRDAKAGDKVAIPAALAVLGQRVNPVRVRSMLAAISRYYPEVEPAELAGIEPWRGLRPCSPDGLPYLGRTGRYSNLLIATGHAMMGVSLGPITGKLASRLLAGEPPGLDIGLLAPDRYGAAGI